MSPQTRSEILRLLEEHGLKPTRRLGQHFLADPNITSKIVRLAGVGPGSQVLEIGAGTGTLTAALSESGASVLAYEIDRRLAPILSDALAGHDVEVRLEDVTQADLARELSGGTWVVVANLPYNIGTPLLLDICRGLETVESMVVMVQLEVARRLTAKAGDDAYGLPSVIASLYTRPSLEFRVPPQVFVPPPRVGSAVVRMVRRPPPPLAAQAVELARAAFGQRRKMLRVSLRSAIDDAGTALAAAEIDPASRAEDIPPEGYLALAGCL